MRRIAAVYSMLCASRFVSIASIDTFLVTFAAALGHAYIISSFVDRLLFNRSSFVAEISIVVKSIRDRPQYFIWRKLFWECYFLVWLVSIAFIATFLVAFAVALGCRSIIRWVFYRGCFIFGFYFLYSDSSRASWISGCKISRLGRNRSRFSIEHILWSSS